MNLLSKVRVYQLAKDLNVTTKDIISKLEELNIEVNNHMSTLEDDEIATIKKIYNKTSESSKTTEVKENDSSSKQKKVGWTIGTPKVNRPKRKSDFVNNTQKNNNASKPAQKQEVKKEEVKKAHVQNKPVATKAPEKKAVENKPAEKKHTTRNQSNAPKQETGNKKTDSKPAVENKPKKKKFKKGQKQVTTDNRTLEEKFSKKVKGKKKKKKYDPDLSANDQVIDEDGNYLIPESITVGELAKQIEENSSDVIMKLMGLGIMANLNQTIDFETAELVCMEYEISTKLFVAVNEDEVLIDTYFEDDKQDDLITRPPVVTVMGHVDHGKTSLLDAIRSSTVTDKEAGGITQHIGASEAMINGQKIVFLDTPGHEAFTTLRARGAQVTDIAVLVVAADDGVMPQTIEAIDHAKAAGVPIIVAINKIDKEGCNPNQVKQELSEHGILVEDWGGDVISVEVSALKGINIDGLLEMIILQSEVLELDANPNRAATGTIIDAKIEKGRGVVATLLVQNGTLSIGDSIVCGSSFGRVRAIFDHLNKRIKKAGPSTGVEITGLNDVPVAGDRFFVVDDDKVARQFAERRQISERNEALNVTPVHVTLEDIFDQIQAGKTKELKIVIKADVQGSLEALKQSLLKVSNEEVSVKIIHSSVGTVTESDVLLASASNAIIIGFNVRPLTMVEELASREGVELKTYRIIYEAIHDVSDALIGMLDPEFKEEVLGKIEVRQVIKIPNVGAIAGGYVLTGKVTRAAEFRLVREGIVIHEGKVSSLRRFKDDVKEVAKGYECGIGFENYNDMKENDIIEAFEMVEIKRKKTKK